MCNCYWHKCEECDETIPMHIGDSNYLEEDFKCWCQKHIDKASKGSIIFEVVEPTSQDNRYNRMEKGWKCAIFGPDVGGNSDNCPNISSDCKEKVV